MSVFSRLKTLLSKEVKEVKEDKLQADTQHVLLTLREIAKGLSHSLKEQLEPLGFKAKGTTLIRLRCPISYDRVHIGVRTFSEYEMSPPFFGADIHVGIHSEPLERLCDQLEGDQYSPQSITFGLNLGYTMPRKSFLDWKFSRERFPEEVAREIVENTLKYGLPYLEQFDNWEAIYTETVRLEARPRIRAPAIKYLMGQFDEAIAILEAELGRIKGQTDSGAQRYRKRANALIEMCKHPNKSKV